MKTKNLYVNLAVLTLFALIVFAVCLFEGVIKL